MYLPSSAGGRPPQTLPQSALADSPQARKARRSSARANSTPHAELLGYGLELCSRLLIIMDVGLGSPFFSFLAHILHRMFLSRRTLASIDRRNLYRYIHSKIMAIGLGLPTVFLLLYHMYMSSLLHPSLVYV